MSAQPTPAIVQGHTIGLPPTSTHLGNKERGLFVSERYFTHRNVKHEWHRLTLFVVIRFVGEKDRVLGDHSSRLLMQGCFLGNDACNIYLIHHALKENVTECQNRRMKTCETKEGKQRREN